MFDRFQMHVAALASRIPVAVRTLPGGFCVGYADGFDAWWVPSTAALEQDLAERGLAKVVADHWRGFLERDQQRTQVLNGFRHYLRQQTVCVEINETGVWRCGRPERWSYGLVDYRLTRKIQESGTHESLAQLIQELGEEPPAPCSLEMLLQMRYPPFDEIPFPEEAELVRLSAQKLACKDRAQRLLRDLGRLEQQLFHRQSRLERFDLAPVQPEAYAALDRLALGFVERFKAECLSGKRAEFPHWSKIWHAQLQHGHWFRAEVDLWVDREWWVALAEAELKREWEPDPLSALEVLNVFGADPGGQLAREELAAWQESGALQVELYYELLAGLYPDHPLAREELEREEDENGCLRERALVARRHFPTLRRVALGFTQDWTECKANGGAIEDDWIVESESFRQMGPDWAAGFLGVEELGALREACCQTAMRLDEPRLRRLVGHLIDWAADFGWPDLVSALLANPILMDVLCTDRQQLCRVILAWSLAQPEGFGKALAGFLLTNRSGQTALAGAIAWLRCRQRDGVMLRA